MQIIREIRNLYVAFCHVCFRRGFFIPSGFGMKNRPQKSVPIFEVDFRSRLSTSISDCVSSALDSHTLVTQSMQIIHRNVDLKCFCFQFYPNICLLLSLYMHISFIYLQGSVETHLRCGGIYTNHIIANCSTSVQVIKCRGPIKSVNNW